MAWLRLDDGFAQHPKLEGWTAPQKWALIELFCYCARHKTEGHVPDDLSLLPRAVTQSVLALAEESGIIDRDEDALTIHDWSVYNPSDPTAADRMRRWRERTPRVRRDKWERARTEVFERDHGVCVDCGDVHEKWHADHQPPRDELAALGKSIYDVAYILTRCPSCHAKVTRAAAKAKRTRTEPPTEHRPNQSVTSRARLPSRPTEASNDASGKRDRDDLWDALVAEIGDVETKDERGARNHAVKQLRDIGATPEDVRRRCAQYRRTWPDITLTDSALVKHWSRMSPSEAREAQPIDEVLGLPDVSDEERQANLERVRELGASVGKAVA